MLEWATTISAGLRRKVVEASALCSDNQLLELADIVHAQLRERRIVRNGEPLEA